MSQVNVIGDGYVANSFNFMNAYERGFLDGLQEALNLMSQEDSIDFGPGKILNKIKQLTGDEDTSLDQKPPSDCTCRTDP